jgi:competence protein ComEC
MLNFKTIPFFKILLPYILGVVFVLKFGLLNKLHLVFVSASLLVITTFLFQKYVKSNSNFKKWIYTISIHVFLFLLAGECCFCYQAKHNGNHYTHFVTPTEQGMIGIIDDLPVVTEKFIKFSIQLKCIETHATWHYVTGNTIVYLKNDSTSNLQIGDAVFINSKFSYVNEPKNLYEFNYKEFLENKNVYHVLYAKPRQVSILKDMPHSFSFMQLGASIKAKVVTVLRNCHLSQQAFSICTALLVGYDDEIDKDVMQSFSHSGTLHILSVSGMHTGLLYGLIITIFLFFDKHDRYKKTKCLVVILSLILFVVITGFSPSVLRAALMLSLVIVGKTFYRQGNSYNTLLVSAFVLLLFNPYLIVDAGFLLSYFAVFGIMYLYPIIHRQHVFKSSIIQWFWNLILMSVAATVFTLPISLYFFHQFPIWFAFSNLIIIPISICLMGATALLLCCYKIAFLKTGLVYIINSFTSIMLWIAQLTDNSNYGYLDYIAFSKVDVVCCVLSLIAFFLFLYTKSYKQLIALGIVIIVWLSMSIVINYQQLQQTELVVFSVKNKSALALRIGKHFYTDTKSLSSNEFQRFIKPYLLNYSNPTIIPITCDALKVNETTILHANNISDLNNDYHAKYIIVSDNKELQWNSLHKTKPIIIADCSNNYNFVKELKKRCAKEGLVFYSVKDKGAFTIKL